MRITLLCAMALALSLVVGPYCVAQAQYTASDYVFDAFSYRYGDTNYSPGGGSPPFVESDSTTEWGGYDGIEAQYHRVYTAPAGTPSAEVAPHWVASGNISADAGSHGDYGLTFYPGGDRFSTWSTAGDHNQDQTYQSATINPEETTLYVFVWADTYNVPPAMVESWSSVEFVYQ